MARELGFEFTPEGLESLYVRSRIVLAARHWLAQQPRLPPCRFDAVLLEPEIRWLKAAFDAS